MARRKKEVVGKKAEPKVEAKTGEVSNIRYSEEEIKRKAGLCIAKGCMNKAVLVEGYCRNCGHDLMLI